MIEIYILGLCYRFDLGNFLSEKGIRPAHFFVSNTLSISSRNIVRDKNLIEFPELKNFTQPALQVL